MSLYIPSQSEIAEVSQSRGADSRAPHLWRGLVGWWPMQEGGGATAFDASGWRNHGTITTPSHTLRGVGPIGRHVYNDANNNAYNITLPDIQGIKYVTLAGWVKSSDVSTVGQLINRDVNDGSGTCSGGRVWQFRTDNTTGVLRAIVWNSSATRAQAASTANVCDGTWHLGTATFNGVAVQVYVDGRPSGSSTALAGVLQTTSTTIALNVKTAMSGCGHAIWSRALLPSEIAQLYADPWAMGTLRRRVFPAAVVGGTPTGAADLAAIASVTAAGRVAAKGSAALSAVSSATATGYASHSGSGDLSAVAALSAVGYVVASGSADLAATGSLDATGYATVSGSAELSAVAEATAAGYATAAGSADLSAVGALEAAGYRVSEGSAELIAIGTFAAAGTVEEVGGGAALARIIGGRFFRRGGKPQFLGAMAFRR